MSENETTKHRKHYGRVGTGTKIHATWSDYTHTHCNHSGQVRTHRAIQPVDAEYAEAHPEHLCGRCFPDRPKPATPAPAPAETPERDEADEADRKAALDESRKLRAALRILDDADAPWDVQVAVHEQATRLYNYATRPR